VNSGLPTQIPNPDYVVCDQMDHSVASPSAATERRPTGARESTVGALDPKYSLTATTPRSI